MIPLWQPYAHTLVDNDDDGETAAGGRLAHLLQILVCLTPVKVFSCKTDGWKQDLDGVLVIVTRFFGGIHLGPDRYICDVSPLLLNRFVVGSNISIRQPDLS